MTLPKAISCKLGVDDQDIKQDLAIAENRAKRVKELYRLGLQAERLGVLKKDVEEKRVKCFNLAAPRKPKLYLRG